MQTTNKSYNVIHYWLFRSSAGAGWPARVARHRKTLNPQTLKPSNPKTLSNLKLLARQHQIGKDTSAYGTPPPFAPNPRSHGSHLSRLSRQPASRICRGIPCGRTRLRSRGRRACGGQEAACRGAEAAVASVQCEELDLAQRSQTLPAHPTRLREHVCVCVCAPLVARAPLHPSSLLPQPLPKSPAELRPTTKNTAAAKQTRR